MKKQNLFYVCLLGIILTGCAVSINTTQHNQLPLTHNAFDMSRTDYTLIGDVDVQFKGTYVLGIGGWKSRKLNAIEMVMKKADASKNQEVVNITTNTYVNIILGIIARRVTTAKGTLIQYNSEPKKDVSEEATPSNNPSVVTPTVTQINPADISPNIYYIAYLFKRSMFDMRYRAEVQELYGMEVVDYCFNNFTTNELKKRSKDHSAEVNKYRMQ